MKQKYARVKNNIALEVFTPMDGFTLAESFHPTIASQFIEVTDDVVARSIFDPVAQTWTAPIVPVQETPIEPATETPAVQ